MSTEDIVFVASGESELVTPEKETDDNAESHKDPNPTVEPRAKNVKKIAIFGTTPSRGEGPWQDDSGWERWTIGPGGKDSHEWERLFECHGMWPESFQGYLNDLSKYKKPKQVIWIPQPNTEAETWERALARWHWQHNIPKEKIEGDWDALVRFPKERVFEVFKRRMWFSSSISYCIGLAMIEGATDIGLWGIDLEAGEEYISQFAGCAHLMDVASMNGINLHLPKSSGLLRDPAPYPDRYETLFAQTLEKKAKWIDKLLSNAEPQYDGDKAELHRLEGKIFALKVLEHNPEEIKNLEQQLLTRNIMLSKLSDNINELKGEKTSLEFVRRMFVWGMNDGESPTIAGPQ